MDLEMLIAYMNSGGNVINTILLVALMVFTQVYRGQSKERSNTIINNTDIIEEEIQTIKEKDLAQSNDITEINEKITAIQNEIAELNNKINGGLK